MNHVLLYACRNCNYKKETANPCVFKHDLLVVARSASLPLEPAILDSCACWLSLGVDRRE